MCLHLRSDQREPKKATEDIVCYKECYIGKPIKLPWSFDNMLHTKTVETYETPFYHMGVALGKTYAADFVIMDNKVFDGLHSFKNDPLGATYDNSVIIECVIPKGATYYEGSGLGLACYASNKLRYVKVLWTNQF